jgi:hypothetical protein
MNDLLRIKSAEPVIHGVLKLSWNDGYVGLVDFRRFLQLGKVYTPLRDPAFFDAVTVEAYGHSIGWTARDGTEIDFGADRLWEMAHEQAELLAKAG